MVTSSPRMQGLVSTALKYPCSRIFEKTRTCKKIAPPKQLKPTLWMSKFSLWWNWASIVKVYQQHISCLFILNTYEIVNVISNNDHNSKRPKRIAKQTIEMSKQILLLQSLQFQII